VVLERFVVETISVDHVKRIVIVGVAPKFAELGSVSKSQIVAKMEMTV
jgi:hypothetical protein